MKLSIFLFIFSLFVLVAKGQSNFSITKGTKFFYVVKTTSGKEYGFDIVINNFSNNGVKFNWIMTSNVSSKGVVTIYKNALDNAIIYKNYFADKSNTKLVKESTVWLSQKNFSELIKQKVTNMALDFNIQKFELEANSTYATIINSKKVLLKTLNASVIGNVNKIIINNDSSNPLIVKMQVKDFSIELKKIIN